MDPKTSRYYSVHAREVFDRYDSSSGGIEKYFPQAFPEKGTILDIGAGSGRDVRRLLREGHQAYGLEPSETLRSLTIEKYPNLASRMLKGHLPDDLDVLDKNFDGVVCSAVLMHIPKEFLFDSLFAIKRILNPNGRALISIPLEREGLDSQRRDSTGRLFTDITAEYIELLFERIGFRRLQKWIDSDSLRRKGVTWTTLLFQLEDIGQTRPIDQIESVLNRDKKVATYKLALFRALCEIAMTSFQKAHWFPDGRVGVPVEDVAEKWISYYWPLIENATFIPQIQGEHETCTKPIAFRQKLGELVEHYRQAGGLAGFTVDLRGNALSPQVESFLKKLMSSLKSTILKGPVTYAGGSLSSGRLFDYDAHNKMIIVDAAIWKELSLMNHWILDALILRWAELTTRLSKEQIQPSEVIDLLLISPLPERHVSDVRTFYNSLGSLECVWSGKSLQKFALDHVIPFSFWRNNDLWNLMPTTPRLNLQKSDKLPAYSLLKRRKDSIISYWDLLNRHFPRRFEYEAQKMTGTANSKPNNWELPLYSALVEAVEVTALQRGCERWDLAIP